MSYVVGGEKNTTVWVHEDNGSMDEMWTKEAGVALQLLTMVVIVLACAAVFVAGQATVSNDHDARESEDETPANSEHLHVHGEEVLEPGLEPGLEQREDGSREEVDVGAMLRKIGLV